MVRGQSSYNAFTSSPAATWDGGTKVALLAGIVLATGAGSASAQPARWQDAPPSVARKVLQEFAWCTVRRESALARSFVLMKNGEQLPPTDFQKLFNAGCLVPLARQLQMRVWQSRAAFAEALLVRDGKGRPVDSFAGVPALEWSVTIAPGQVLDPAMQARLAAENASNQAVGQLGECVARADPVSSMAVLRTDIDTRAERARFAALAPRIAACVQQGQTRTFNRTNLRAGMALAYYRLAAAATAQGNV